jgi:glyoxylase-like metal-dependent hydrolase (beta-lactamase superfamily II)
MKNKTIIQFLCVLVCLGLFFPAAAKEEVKLELQNVSGNVYCLYGQGGNIGILKADDGLLVIDSQSLQMAEKILKKIATLSPKPIKYLINTHYHGDHTSGNEAIGKKAAIIMHPNCRNSLIQRLKEQETEKAYLSIITPWTEGMVFKLGDETVRLLHFGHGHTAGDVVVVFEKAKVFHTGDLFFHGIAPYIDVKDGSDTGNWVKTIEALCKKYPDFKVIPGHGKVTDTKEYLKFAEYLKYLRKETAAAIKAGKTKEQAMESINTEKNKGLKEYGNFMTIKNNIGWIYDEMSRPKNK